MFFYSLCSSSKGNASFLGDSSGGILFDAGIGIRNFVKALAQADIDPGCIRAVFISHDHSDHVMGLESISTRYQIPVYGSRGTLESLLQKGIISGRQKLCALEGPVEAAGFYITPFATPHDSADSIGFHVDCENGLSAAVCTDLGHPSDTVMRGILGCDFIMLESNYDRRMLLTGSYPAFLKQRINSRSGHLSNDQCAQVLEQLIPSGTKQVLLAHLSEENNRPEVAKAHSVNYLANRGIREGIDYRLDVLPRFTEGRRFTLT